MQISTQSQNVFIALSEKASDSNLRMPSVKSISKLLTEVGIKHELRDSVNIVEHRTKGRMYVNSRHSGKKGMLIEFPCFRMDTSESYYSINSWGYAQKLVSAIENHM